MGLIASATGKFIRGAATVTELVCMTFDKPAFPTMSESLDFVRECEGPDDLLPPEDAHTAIVERLANPLVEQEPEILVSDQWGLKLPSGEVSWNVFQGTHLNSSIDRVQMIARIQQTALDAGFSQEQLTNFLSNYEWVTRSQIASVVYEDTGSYSLTDPQASQE
jgi:hypothetical protein